MTVDSDAIADRGNRNCRTIGTAAIQTDSAVGACVKLRAVPNCVLVADAGEPRRKRPAADRLMIDAGSHTSARARLIMRAVIIGVFTGRGGCAELQLGNDRAARVLIGIQD